MKRSIWLGYEPREIDALQVCANSIKAHLSEDIPIYTVDLDVLRARGLYQRPTRFDAEALQLFDVISDAPMSTAFAISRFFVPHLAEGDDWALFMDCDMLVREDLSKLFALADHQKAIQVVQHDAGKFTVGEKMDGQAQTVYARKNWSSVMLWNLKHDAHRRLTLFALNQWTGRALHNFAWIGHEKQIGALPSGWNHLVGVDPPNEDAQIAHFTLGIPRMRGYENSEHAEEWRSYLPFEP
jgi:lipopolysaccharide biosynthesis glycosyltransferase